MGKKKILFLFGNRPTSLIVNMAALLNQAGYNCLVAYHARSGSRVEIPLPSGADFSKYDFISTNVGKHWLVRSFGRIRALCWFTVRVWKESPIVVHAWHFDTLIAAYFSLLVRPRTKLIFHMQDTYPWMRGLIGRVVQKVVYKRVDQFFVTARPFENEFLRKFHLIQKQKPVVFMPNVPLRSMFSEHRERMNPEGLTIGYFGFIRGRSAISSLINAVESVSEQGYECRVVFAGIGVETEYVRELAEHNSQVDFLGPYKYQDIEDLYSQVDILYAVYDDGYDKKIHLAYRLCEAINCGLPIIVTKDTHMAELTEHYKVGASVTCGDSENLVSILIDLIENREKVKTYSENCRLARPDFVFENFQDSILSAYAGLTSD